jgi:hypothetical protein
MQRIGSSSVAGRRVYRLLLVLPTAFVPIELETVMYAPGRIGPDMSEAKEAM